MDNKTTNHPLVSIVVVSYNAADTVIETLESVRNQTYDNIELILSDDCSKDDTVKLAKEWFTKNSFVFREGAQLLTADVNQGVCANFNKAIRSSKGEWVKIIAADDILLPNCCADYVDYSTSHPEAQFISSYISMYNNCFEEDKCMIKQFAAKDMTFFDKDCKEQLKQMAYQIYVTAPSMFFSKKVFNEIGGFDERYSYEDHPFYINLLEHGYKLYFMPKLTAGYRVHDSMYNSNEKLFNYQFKKESKKFHMERCYKYYGFRQKLAVSLYYGLLTVFERLHLNKKTKVTQCIYRVLMGGIWAIGK